MIWAEENSRDAIFDALKRRETFATSGPRIVPRFYGAWDLPDDICDSKELASVADAAGVSSRRGRQQHPTHICRLARGFVYGDQRQLCHRTDC